MYANNRKSMLYDKKKPLIMGVLNITDDSFFDKSRILSKKMLFDKIHEMRSVGVSILDIGACSTRPDSSPVSLEEELRRLESVMPFLREEFPDILVSVDFIHFRSAFQLIYTFKLAKTCSFCQSSCVVNAKSFCFSFANKRFISFTKIHHGLF